MRPPMPASLALLGKAAGLDARELTGRSLSLPGAGGGASSPMISARTRRRSMSKPRSVSRRAFLEQGATTAGVTLVARHVLGGPRHVPPSDKISVAYVGVGTQGMRQLMPALQRDDLRITAVCDPNRRSEDYVEWSRFELRDKVRAFLYDPGWAAGARACPCGREVGREIVDRHYGASRGRRLPGLRRFPRAAGAREGPGRASTS